MEIKLFVAREIEYFELGNFSFNSYVYYLTRCFIASTRAFNLLTRAFNLPTRAFSLPTCAFNLVTRAYSVLTRESELVTRGIELVTRGFELVTRNSCFTFPPFNIALRLRDRHSFFMQQSLEILNLFNIVTLKQTFLKMNTFFR